MMCVNDAFDWPVSVRWLLITRRFSSSALTGMLRIDVAVGIVSDTSMFWAIFDAAPRRGVTFAPEGTGARCSAGNLAGVSTGAVVAGVGAGADTAGAGRIAGATPPASSASG